MSLLFFVGVTESKLEIGGQRKRMRGQGGGAGTHTLERRRNRPGSWGERDDCIRTVHWGGARSQLAAPGAHRALVPVASARRYLETSGAGPTCVLGASPRPMSARCTSTGSDGLATGLLRVGPLGELRGQGTRRGIQTRFVHWSLRSACTPAQTIRQTPERGHSTDGVLPWFAGIRAVPPHAGSSWEA